jgi:flagellar basal body-associated protein FliL
MRFAAAPGEASQPAPSSSADDKVPLTVEFAPLVVDLRSADGVMHHLKVALSAEVPPEVTTDEVTSAMPRGRQAAIMYLRAVDYDEATKPEAFQAFQAELSKHIIAAMGPKRVSAILVTDFISQ